MFGSYPAYDSKVRIPHCDCYQMIHGSSPACKLLTLVLFDLQRPLKCVVLFRDHVLVLQKILLSFVICSYLCVNFATYLN